MLFHQPRRGEYTYNGRNIVSTLAPSFLIGSSSFLQVRRTTIKAWMCSNFGGISQMTEELPALERLKVDVFTPCKLSN